MPDGPCELALSLCGEGDIDNNSNVGPLHCGGAIYNDNKAVTRSTKRDINGAVRGDVGQCTLHRYTSRTSKLKLECTAVGCTQLSQE